MRARARAHVGSAAVARADFTRTTRPFQYGRRKSRHTQSRREGGGGAKLASLKQGRASILRHPSPPTREIISRVTNSKSLGNWELRVREIFICLLENVHIYIYIHVQLIVGHTGGTGLGRNVARQVMDVRETGSRSCVDVASVSSANAFSTRDKSAKGRSPPRAPYGLRIISAIRYSQVEVRGHVIERP